MSQTAWCTTADIGNVAAAVIAAGPGKYGGKTVMLSDSDSDNYMCLLHRTGAHWIARMGGLYPPQAKVETGSVGR